MIVLPIVLASLGAAAVYAGYTHWAYYRVPPAERPCQGGAARAAVNGYDLYYREVGQDTGQPPVVLVHGGPGHSSLSFKGSFDFLAAERRVIYYDQRGSGCSQSRARPADYTLEHLVEELEILRQTHIRAERLVLVGHSFGSALVQRYALRYPQHTTQLVLVGGIRINNGMRGRWAWRWLGPALYALSMKVPPPTAEAADAWFTQQTQQDAGRLFDPTRKDLLEGQGSLSFAAWRELSLSLVGDDYRAALRQLPIPTLFIYGVADSPFTGRPVADELCATLPNCRAARLDRSGHWPFLEQPEAFQAVFREFLAARPQES